MLELMKNTMELQINCIKEGYELLNGLELDSRDENKVKLYGICVESIQQIGCTPISIINNSLTRNSLTGLIDIYNASYELLDNGIKESNLDINSGAMLVLQVVSKHIKILEEYNNETKDILQVTAKEQAILDGLKALKMIHRNTNSAKQELIIDKLTNTILKL